MNTKNIILTGRGLAIAIVVLGIIHDAATFSPLIKSGLACLDAGNLNAMMYMSLMCGTSLILSGILLYLMLRKVAENRVILPMMFVIGVFLALNGILSVVYMFNNPFAWMALVLNMGMIFIIFGIRNSNRQVS
ncbi:MAG: hypothetical protein AB9834_05970 [Lentimicrobium sp.]